MSGIIEDATLVTGQIYVIQNSITNKYYIGQTVSHRKNRGKYRPFGFMGRFKDHISEAICNSKKKQCTYLNHSIRKHGADTFTCKLIHECSLAELDVRESHYIRDYDTLFPNGYNLTKGGKLFKSVASDLITQPENVPKKRGGCVRRSLETREKMSKSLKELMSKPEIRTEQMKRTQKQHFDRKLEMFKDVKIGECLEDYISIIHLKDGREFVRVRVEQKKVAFYGKYETIDILKERAIKFLKQIKSATLSN